MLNKRKINLKGLKMEYAFSVKKIVEGNGLAISITGMLIVFTALLSITIFLILLPKILKIVEKYYPETDHGLPIEMDRVEDRKKLVAAIGYVLLKNWDHES